MTKQSLPPGMIRLREMVDKEVRERGTSWSVESVRAGLGKSTLHNVLHSRRSMRPSTARKIARHFGFREEEVFELADLATPRHSGDPLTDALVAIREAPVDGSTRQGLVLLLQAAAGRDVAWRERVQTAIAEVQEGLLNSTVPEGADEPSPHDRLAIALETLRMRLLA